MSGNTTHDAPRPVAGTSRWEDTALAAKDDELDQLRASLRDLLNWVEQLPVKHPQQARARERARLLVKQAKE